MSFLRSLNRKQRRNFDKLDQEEKNQIISKEIADKVKEVAQKQIAASFVRGVEWSNKIMYEKYVTAWDAAKYEEKRKVAKQLIEEIRSHYQKYSDMHKEKSEDENKSEEK